MHAKKNIRACLATLDPHSQRPFVVMPTMSSIVHISAYLTIMKKLRGSEGHTSSVAGIMQSLHCTFAHNTNVANYG